MSALRLNAQEDQALQSDSCNFYMPNTITPDCEDYGCQFLWFNLECELEDFYIEVYNRWGEVLYESNDQEEL